MTWHRMRLCVLAAGSFLTVPTCQDSREELVPPRQKIWYGKAITNTKKKIMQAMTVANIPGACCVVTVDGVTVMKAGFGFSDVENCTRFTSKTSMRIASISKFITALVTLRLAQDGKLDLDEPLGAFFSSHLTTHGLQDGMTVRQLLNHTAGIRHYRMHDDEEKDSHSDEFYSSTNYSTVLDGLQMFIHDELESAPGSTFKYTTFGYSLLSFILEKCSEKTFETLISEFKADLGLPSIFLDKSNEIVLNRSRYYSSSDKGALQNTPSVDNSNKWAGGGLVSNAEDIAHLGDILLYLIQSEDSADRYLDAESIKAMKSPNTVTEYRRKDGREGFYGLGLLTEPEVVRHGKVKQFYRVYHTGGAVGASSILMVVPFSDHLSPCDGHVSGMSPCDGHVSGMSVVLFCNHEDGGQVVRLAAQIANEFTQVIEEQLD